MTYFVYFKGGRFEASEAEANTVMAMLLRENTFPMVTLHFKNGSRAVVRLSEIVAVILSEIDT